MVETMIWPTRVADAPGLGPVVPPEEQLTGHDEGEGSRDPAPSGGKVPAVMRWAASAARASVSARRRGERGAWPGPAASEYRPSSATAASIRTNRRRVRSRRSAISWPVGIGEAREEETRDEKALQRGGAHVRRAAARGEASTGSPMPPGATPWKERRWSGHGPSRASASRCAAVAYPLCCRKP